MTFGMTYDFGMTDDFGMTVMTSECTWIDFGMNLG